MEKIGFTWIVLATICIIVFAYGIYLFFDQKRNLQILSKKSKYTPIVCVVLVLLGFLNYRVNGKGYEEIIAGMVLVGFAFLMLISKNGRGENAIYMEGLKFSWKKVKKISVKREQEKVYLHFEQNKNHKKLLLENITLEEAEKYLKRIKKIYHLGK